PALVAEGDFMQKGGFEAARRLIDLPQRPTAIFAANDMSALGALAAIRKAGLHVPEDMSLIGFDDLSLAGQFHPALSTVHQPL
ncbi:substrate-binding domain-containing protein, partial [Mycobacterium tuberculosis]|nr:substrate-binding domain-containing protein [Mycobacterium tuberculosis]